MNRSGFGLIGLLVTLGVVVVLGGGAFYGYQGGLFGGGTASSTITAPIDAANKAKELLEKNNQEIATDWKTYKNDLYNYQISYPATDYNLAVLNNGGLIQFTNKHLPGDIPDVVVTIDSSNNEAMYSSNLPPEEIAKNTISSWGISPEGRERVIRSIKMIKFAEKDAAEFNHDYVYRVFTNNNAVFTIKTFLASPVEFQRDYSFVNTFKLLK